MKWIGQHIWSFISRFRNDVYLEQTPVGTPQGYLGLDTDKKIIQFPVPVTGSGDITSIQIATDDGINPALETSGAAEFRILSQAGSGLTVTNSNTSSITIGMGKAGSGTTGTASFASADFAVSGAGHVTANAASTTARGSASFDTNNFTVSSGAVSARTASTTVEGMTTLISENDMASNSSTKPPTQSSVKAYVDASTYTHPTSAGNKHIPAGGSSGQFLKYDSSGTAVWAADNNTTYSVGDGGLTTNDFTNADHSKLNGIETSATADQSSAEILTAIEDGVDSVHYVDGSIDTAHIADDQVTFAKAQGVTPNVYGNTIKILPSDFMVNEDVNTSPLNFKDGSNSGVQVADGASEMIAFVAIPQGMKATALDIYSTHAKTVKVYELDVDASFNFNLATPNETGSANTQITIDPAIHSTAINYLVITYVSTATTNRVWGGLLTIAAI